MNLWLLVIPVALVALFVSRRITVLLLKLAFSPVLAAVRFPIQVRDYVVAATLEKKASAMEKNVAALSHQADVAAVLWGSGSDYRGAARRILANVCLDFGIRPNVVEADKTERFSPAAANAASIVSAGTRDAGEISIAPKAAGDNQA